MAKWVGRRPNAAGLLKDQIRVVGIDKGSGKNLVCLCRFQNDFGWFETPIQDRGSDQRDTMGTVGRPTHALLLAHPGVGNLVDTSFRPGTRDW